jgi:hypothetical protein
MIRTCLDYLLAALLLLGPVAQTAMAAPKGGPKNVQRPSAEEVKIKVAKLGTGAKAKATVWLADGTKVKGYISQPAENDFVMRDRKTDVPTTIRYADVVKFDRNRGHSTAKWMGIGIGVGVGAFLIIMFASIAHLD